MSVRTPVYLQPFSIEDALARARAERAAYVRKAFVEASARLKRVAASIRPDRHPLPRKGVRA